MTAQEAYDLAGRKARYGHRDWVVWKDKTNEHHAELCTADSLKRALLATGTQGHFTVKGSDSISYFITWSLGVSWFKSYRAGYVSY